MCRLRGNRLRSRLTGVMKNFNKSRCAKGKKFATRWNVDGTAVGYEVFFQRGVVIPTMMQVTSTFIQF